MAVTTSVQSSQEIAYLCALSLGPLASAMGRSRIGGMEYKQFIIKAFEQKRGKWRANVWRSNGRAIKIMGPKRTRLYKFVTGVDGKNAEAAVLMAITAIDAGAFSSRINASANSVVPGVRRQL
jgi:hypothetical protein